MLQCAECSHPIMEANRYCPHCGAVADVSSTPTGTAPRAARATPRRATDAVPGPSSAAPGAPAPSAGHGRFVPGTIVAERYRIAGLLGRGGMGEVYRADDLKLGQPVALKFLPPALQDDPERRDRLHNEVRLARQISHPTICRVHDIGEVDGQQFLTMEYVDGENLTSLLRRIGRLPPDKALDIARQLALALAAAHDRGVLHRDLKPENVMLDGRGHVRVTDFGLATLADAVHGEDVRSGTPAYMSPEQLEGRDVTTRSDLYSLGVLLFELFTGRKPFEGRSFAELARKHREDLPPAPSSVADGIPPDVESVILHCLEKEPAARPASALGVAAALPGGDPLAAALAAGETPSPEMVAAAREREGLRPAAAWLAAALVAAGLLAVVVLARRATLPGVLPLEKAPAALEDRAREIVAQLAGTRAFDTANGFDVDEVVLEHATVREGSAGRVLVTGRVPAVQFWYRQSLQPLASTGFSGRVAAADPPVVASGMAGVRFDVQGRLVSFYSVPPQLETAAAPGAAPAPDWPALFAHARLDRSRLREVEPRWTPPFYADSRSAWEGADPESPDDVLRVESAAYRGRPVYFHVLGPWTRPERMRPGGWSERQRVAFTIDNLIALGVVVASALLAHRNLRLGRGDRRGARRVAGYLFVVATARWLICAHHVPDLFMELGMAVRGLGANLLGCAVLWMLYLALEPFVRRRWPGTLISWTRLLDGRVRDPRVGRDALLGVAGGVLMTVLALVGVLVPEWLGAAPVTPPYADLDVTLGLRLAAGKALNRQAVAVAAAMAILLLLVPARLLLRNVWLAGLVVSAVVGLPNMFSSQAPAWIQVPTTLAILAIPTAALLRFGLLAGIVVLYVEQLLEQFPLAWGFTGWSGGTNVLAVLVVAGLAAYGLRTALAGRPAAA